MGTELLDKYSALVLAKAKQERIKRMRTPIRRKEQEKDGKKVDINKGERGGR